MLALVPCGLASAESKPTTKTWKVALVLPGRIDDNGFNEIGYHGLMRIKKELGAEVVYSEDTQPANWDRVIRGFCEDNADIVILHGTQFGKLMPLYAQAYPKTYFLDSEGPPMAGPNYCTVGVRSNETAFLAGILAGYETKSGKVGAMLGFDFPLMVAEVEAFRLGLRSALPSAQASVVYLGTFDSPTLGKEAGLNLIDAGADVLWHVADSSGVGMIQAARERGIKVVGYGLNQNHLAPDQVLSTMMVDTGGAFFQVCQEIMAGKFQAVPRNFGLDTPFAGLSKYNDAVTPEIARKVELWKQALVAGKITVPFLTDRDASEKLSPLQLPAP